MTGLVLRIQFTPRVWHEMGRSTRGDATRAVGPGLEFGLFRSPNVGGLYKMTRSWYKLRL